MSKIRIYELARELGLENKAIIAMAAQAGVSGKLSHSSSLESDEAEQIRRSAIRSTVGSGSEESNSSEQSETVTTRLDKSTGETQAVVERRTGNVIRRRRTTDAATIASAEDGTDPQVSPEASESSEESAVEASAVEASAAEGAPAEIAAEAAFTQVEASATNVAQESSTAAGSTVAPARAGPRVLGRLEKPEPAKPVLAKSGLNDAAREFSARLGESASAVGVHTVAASEPRKAAGPRVLGKIELPQPRVAPTSSRSDSGRPIAGKVVTAARDEEEEGGKGSGARKKGRKREIDRRELVDYEGREPRRAGGRQGPRRKEVDPERQAAIEASKPKASKRVVKLDEFITVGELAKQMSLKAGEIIAKLMQLGIMATINQAIDADTATVIAEEFEFQVERTTFIESDILEDTTPEDPGQQLPRAPVVTVMGHVDHGKTSLLDALRQTTVAEREHGGITQHIGAYQVPVEGRGMVTFIDTPGHAAFTAMRARGAKVTDIVILVVAADDGVMPQTLEAVSHAKAAAVPIIVAVNKCDKQDANPDRIKQQLSDHGLSPEDWGGDTMYYKVSALKKQGLKELLEGIMLQAEVKELKANPDRRARGTLIESRQDKGRGTVATALIQNGTLRVGDVFIAGAEYGRVRSMVGADGAAMTEAGPSVPVEITGFTGVPEAGDDFFVVESEAKAREVFDERRAKKTLKDQRSAAGPISLEEFSRRANSIVQAELNIVLKADVHGSLEAVTDAIEQLSTEKVKVRVLHSAVGGITENDIQLAVASRAIVVGFGVRAEARAQAEAESIGIELRFYRIIYELLDDVKKAMVGLLAPVKEEHRTGRVEVRETFNVPKMGTVAGCYVLDGMVRRGAFVRLLRDSKVVHEGKMASLRRFKDDVREVQSGYECGVMLENYNDVKPGDQFEVFEVKEVAATL